MARVVGSVRRAVAEAARGRPTVSEWVERVQRCGDERVVEAVSGVWVPGREGRAERVIPGSAARYANWPHEEQPGTERVLVVGWANGRVEFSYVS